MVVSAARAEARAVGELADRLTAELAELRKPWWRRLLSGLVICTLFLGSPARAGAPALALQVLQRGLGPLADHLALPLAHGGQEIQHHTSMPTSAVSVPLNDKMLISAANLLLTAASGLATPCKPKEVTNAQGDDAR